MRLNDIFQNTSYGDSLFTSDEVAAIESRITTRTVKGKSMPYITCLVRNKELRLTPEEVVRQLYIYRLINGYGYPADRLRVEFAVNFGLEVKRADIVIMDKLNLTAAYIIVEVKKPKLKDGKEQLKSYTNATGAPIAVWTNGEQISCYNRKDPNYFEQISDIPKAAEKLSDILNERITYAELKERDKIAKEKRSLRDLIVEIEDEVLANAGVDSFEEVFKLIFSKLYDEMVAANDANCYLQFRNSGDTDSELKAKIDILFKAAKKKWNGIFTDSDAILLSPSHLSVCVSTLQDVKLFNNNLDVVDDAFEYLMSKSQKGEKGQYFTPRYVIDMCVRMMNPQENENIIDTAAGSSGFPVHAIFHVWHKIRADLNLPVGEGFTTGKRTERETAFVRDHIFAIDFDEKTVRVARTLNLIAGDGQSNVIHLNALDYGRWDEVTAQRTWQRNYSAGYNRLLDLRPRGVSDSDYSQFAFDLLMANPPFAGDIKEGTILARYELGKNDKGKQQSKVGRDILFIERNLNFLAPGGRMAIVLPQGRFNNSSDRRIRDFITERCRILAVVGLHDNVFKPHTGTKTSVLFVQKWDDEKCPKKDDYPIFFATMQKPSKDSSGDKIYVVDDETHEPKLDSHGHLIVDHDLYNHDGLTADGIAEAFAEFARRENLSFFVHARPFDAERYAALMSGLEVSEVWLGEILNSYRLRLDSEYYKKEYLENEKYLSSNHKIRDFCNSNLITIKTLKLNKPCNYLEISNVGLSNIEYQTEKIAYNDIPDRATYILHDNDIAVSTVRPNRNAIAFIQNSKRLVGTSGFTILRTNKKMSPFYLYAFCKTKFFINKLMQENTATMYPAVSDYDVLNVNIPTFSIEFQKVIENKIKQSLAALARSQHLYNTAESRLLSALGMDNFVPSAEPVAVKSFSESFGTSGRLDAEYYQPKYDEYGKLLLKYDIAKMEDICDNINYGTVPTSPYTEDETGIPYIKGMNLCDLAIRNALDKVTGTKDLPEKFYTRKNDIIISQMGTVGDVGVITEAEDGFLFASFTIRVRIKDINKFNPYYVGLFIQRVAKEWYLRRNIAQASVRQNTDLPTIRSMPVPIIETTIQEQIAVDVQRSFALRRESERLLDTAKRAVEMAIERGEDNALQLLVDYNAL